MVPRDLCRPFIVAALLSVFCVATADVQPLQCVNGQELQHNGIYWSCQNFGTVLVRQNTTYYLTVDAASATYQQFDINITLTSLIGDADLIVGTPGATSNLASTRNVGQDIVFVYRTELAAGQYTVMVLGYALESQYELTIDLVETQRALRPVAALALGQMMVSCCATEVDACMALKMGFPELSSDDRDMNPDFCAMHGNVCSRDGYLLELGAFAGGDLSCEFPAASIMKVFTRLQRIDLSGNRISGNITTIAQTLSQLPALKYVDLGYDQIEGPLDTACGLAATKKLQQLNLMDNALTGNIPACITQLPQMVELHLDYNQLTGAIPAFPSSNSPLVYFTAAYQLGFMGGLSGEVPQSLGKMQQLGYLDIAGNMLTGALPAVTSGNMINLRLAENFLTGTISPAYGLMENLVSLELDNNGVEGTLPPALANMPALKALDLSGNQLTGALPVDWSGASNLIMLLLSNNSFSGALPASLANVESMVVLDASNNQLGGTLNDFAFQAAANRADVHSALRYFAIANNSFAGDLTHAEGLKRLAVFSNSAPDQVPLSEMMMLAANTTTSQIKLRAGMTPRTFDISYNLFSGAFPEWLVDELAQCKEDITIILDGDRLICPAHGFTLGRQAPAGRLDGLMCYSASSSELITDATPMASITSMVYVEHHGLSSGAVAGIVILVLVLVAAVAGLGVWLHKRRQQSSMFQPFDKFDSGSASGAMSGPTNVYASSKFGGRTVYPDMEEVEMGPAAKAQSPKSFQSVNLKSGRKLDLP